MNAYVINHLAKPANFLSELAFSFSFTGLAAAVGLEKPCFNEVPTLSVGNKQLGFVLYF